MRRRVTIREVAERAGVSNATVSVVMSGSASNSRVSDETRRRVLDVARAIGYQPNAIARSLRRRSTNTIGFYCGYGYLDTTLPFFSEVIGGLQKGCDSHRKDLLLHGVFPERPVEEIYAELIDGRVDGLVVYAPEHDPLVGMLASSHLPVVAIVDALPGLPSVAVDDARGGALIARYLAGKGHRRVLYWAAWRLMASSDRRRRGFMRAAADLGLEVEETTAFPNSGEAAGFIRQWRDTQASRRPTAVACWNDGLAYLVLTECRLQGMQTPEDLAITGFDGIVSAFGPALCLTTVCAPWMDVARQAISMLAHGDEDEEILLPVELVAGDTA